jgi:hypothetical protein
VPELRQLDGVLVGDRLRKQYHFRPGTNGLRAWDVDRLVALTRQLEPQLVPLAEIRELDEHYWGERMTPRSVAAHARLIQEADLSYPVILSSDGRIMDGMHRAAKAALLGNTHLLAVRFEVDPEPDHVGVHPDDLPYDEPPDA